MKFPPILHRAALFCLFGLIVIAVIGGAIHWVGFKEWLRSWQELIGAGIGGAIAGAAIWITTRETRNALTKQLEDRKNARKDETARILSNANTVLEIEIGAIDRLINKIKAALGQNNESARANAIKMLHKGYLYEHRQILLNCCDRLGDANPLISKTLLHFHQNAKDIVGTLDELAEGIELQINSLPLREGNTARRTIPVLGMVWAVKGQAEIAKALVEHWHEENGTAYLLVENDQSKLPPDKLKRIAPILAESERLRKQFLEGGNIP